MGRPPKGYVIQPDIKEKNASLSRGILRSFVRFFKRGLYKEYFKGKIVQSLFKGFDEDDH